MKGRVGLTRLLPLLLAAVATACGTGLAPSPTPDLRVLKIDAPLLLMDATDLPTEGKYILPGIDWTGHLDNQAVLNAWGAAEGGTYIAETGRVDGWWIQFNRTSSEAALPAQVYDSVVVYQTVAGARLSVEKYAGHGMKDYVEVEGTTQIGDGARAFILKKGGNADYVLYFSFRNCQHVVEIVGPEGAATPAFANRIAEALLHKMESAPLASPGG